MMVPTVYIVGAGVMVLMRLLRLTERVLLRSLQSREVSTLCQGVAGHPLGVEATWTGEVGTLQRVTFIGSGAVPSQGSARTLATW